MVQQPEADIGALPLENSDTSDTIVKEFVPMDLSIEEIRRAIPDRLFQRSTLRGLGYLLRDLAMAAALFYGALHIDDISRRVGTSGRVGAMAETVTRWILWLTYWWFQGLVFTGLWVLGHECGHGAFSEKKWVCDTIGYIIHTALWTPYFSWKISHHRHHRNHASMERDEVYVPWTRAELGLPADPAGTLDYAEYFGDTPLYTLAALVAQQLFAFPAYLTFNVSGQRSYPRGTNHWDPRSVLFTRPQRTAVLLSNLGLACTAALTALACTKFGAARVAALYGAPWLAVNHWFVMITYLHHTHAALPHFRARAWTFARGAAATVDRPFLGATGEVLLHGVARWHVVHHFFPKMPFYHAREATAYLKAALGAHYHYADAPAFRALWESYNACQFVEDTGDVVFYRDRKGRFAVRPAQEAEGAGGQKA
ncbi:fatty acid desaturase-domain-containing protein [Phanerochaete sordida]|uniref:Fatty acid desaturase-domain-containing protein n=1 Tax=Phanerochaete sordida TaxID=48140 RepID=A0A9P3LC87_9APHY|nr:fatty acid desaturase-domain-containing protein [Phanerochaete sordida]